MNNYFDNKNILKFIQKVKNKTQNNTFDNQHF